MFYTYSQNNSGGSFERNDNVCEYVIVEADSFEDADRRAEDIGIYFNGVADGFDCNCCGDRWQSAYDWSVNEEPCIYGKPLREHTRAWAREKAYIYYKDGSKLVHHFKEREEVMEISQEIIDFLLKAANTEIPEDRYGEDGLDEDGDWFNPCDASGGNFDDAYSMGKEAGAIEMARAILRRLGISGR